VRPLGGYIFEGKDIQKNCIVVHIRGDLWYFLTQFKYYSGYLIKYETEK
jgi:hypothetical protein